MGRKVKKKHEDKGRYEGVKIFPPPLLLSPDASAIGGHQTAQRLLAQSGFRKKRGKEEEEEGRKS
jgi:hypothetical protein